MSSREAINCRAVVSYNGSGFHGLAPNPGVRTVVGEIVRVLEERIGQSPDIVMSGRTDAGVHAVGQVLNFQLIWEPERLGKIQDLLNNSLAPEVVVTSIETASETFSARFDATSRSYLYRIDQSGVADPFRSVNHWHLPEKLDIDAMNQAAAHFVGSHDFSSFCRRPKGSETEPSMVREVTSAVWTSCGRVDDSTNILHFNIAGTAFCHQMVRSITGFCVAVGKGKRSADEVPSVLEAKDRNKAEQLAPPHGLTLVSVDY